MIAFYISIISLSLVMFLLLINEGNTLSRFPSVEVGLLIWFQSFCFQLQFRDFHLVYFFFKVVKLESTQNARWLNRKGKEFERMFD